MSPSATNGGMLRPMLMGLQKRPGLLCLEKEMLTIILAATAWEMQDQGRNVSQETAWEPQGHPLKKNHLLPSARSPPTASFSQQVNRPQ